MLHTHATVADPREVHAPTPPPPKRKFCKHKRHGFIVEKMGIGRQARVICCPPN